MGQEDKNDSKEMRDWDGAIPDDEELPAYSEAGPAIVNAHPNLHSTPRALPARLRPIRSFGP
jgi:hypothetical protein